MRWRIFSGNRPLAAATEVTVSVTAISSNTGSANTAGASPINRPCVAAAKIRRRAGLAAAPGSALQSAAGADQIIENHDRAIAHLANQQLAADYPAAAPLFDKGGGRLFMQFGRERTPELLGAFGAANVG